MSIQREYPIPIEEHDRCKLQQRRIMTYSWGAVNTEIETASLHSSDKRLGLSLVSSSTIVPLNSGKEYYEHARRHIFTNM